MTGAELLTNLQSMSAEELALPVEWYDGHTAEDVSRISVESFSIELS